MLLPLVDPQDITTSFPKCCLGALLLSLLSQEKKRGICWNLQLSLKLAAFARSICVMSQAGDIIMLIYQPAISQVLVVLLGERQPF